jgi:hypothetical protein
MNLTIYMSEWEAYTRPEQIIDNDWDDIADILLDFHQADKKEDVTMFNLWELNLSGELGRKLDKKTGQYTELPGTIRRCSDNLVGLHGLVLDFDANLTMDEAIKEVEGFEYVVYTTFNHSKEQHKFRLVLPFTRMMTVEEFELKVEHMKRIWPKADRASFTKSQAIFFHSGKSSKDAISFRYPGVKIDPDIFINKKPAQAVGYVDLRIQNTSVTKKGQVTELEVVLQQIKGYYPSLEYVDWLAVTFAVAHLIGDDAAPAMLSRFWPEKQKGEYVQRLRGRNKSGSPTMGTLKWMIKEKQKELAPVIKNTNKF